MSFEHANAENTEHQYATSAVSKREWELTPRGRMVAILAALAVCGAWVTGDPHAALAASLLLSPILVDRIWRGWGLPNLRIQVRERRTCSGALFMEEIRLANPSRRWARDLRVCEQKLSAGHDGVFVEALPPGHALTLRLPSRVRRRCVLRKRVFNCESSYPLGMLAHRIEIYCATYLVSEPSRTELPAHALQSLDSGDVEAAIANRGVGEFWALREYRAGEDYRRVHALRSATAGTPVSVITRGTEPQEPCVVLDLRRPRGHPANRTDPRFEWSLSTAATITDELLQTARGFTLFLLSTSPKTFDVANADEAEALLAELAEARPCPHRSIDPAMLESIASHGHSIWIPAGGYGSTGEKSVLPSFTELRPDSEAE